jgi:hypothetical protein
MAVGQKLPRIAFLDKFIEVNVIQDLLKFFMALSSICKLFYLLNILKTYSILKAKIHRNEKVLDPFIQR